MKGYVKDPDATLDYTFDWSQWLGSDIIDSSTFIINKSGLSAVPASDTFDDTTTRVFITGGALGDDYELTNRITTIGGRTDDRTIQIQVRER